MRTLNNRSALDVYMRAYLEDLRWTLTEIDREALQSVIDLFVQARLDGRQILLIGNGGSAATASHMACDLGKGTAVVGDPTFVRFRVLSLCDNSALMTAIGNDISYNEVFVEQLALVMRPQDVVVLISASGNSPNLLRAAEYAKAGGAKVVSLLGFGGGALARMSDLVLTVSTRNYGIAEDFHLIVNHILTQFVRRALAGPARPVAFLDRDGVINERPAPQRYVERWEEFRLLDGAVPLLQSMSRMGYALVIVTNQQGVGKGLLTRAALDALHGNMRDALKGSGIVLDGIFVCPHLADSQCFCRKPMPGLIHRALNELPFQVDLARSVLVGDSVTDMAAGEAAGVPVRVLVSRELTAEGAATHVVSSIDQVCGVLLSPRTGGEIVK